VKFERARWRFSEIDSVNDLLVVPGADWTTYCTRIVVRFLNSDRSVTAFATMGAMALASLSRPLCVERRTIVIGDNAVVVTGFYTFTRMVEGKPVPSRGSPCWSPSAEVNGA
jgi:hypothetical protein